MKDGDEGRPAAPVDGDLPTLGEALARWLRVEGARSRAKDPATTRAFARLPPDGLPVPGLGLGTMGPRMFRRLGNATGLARTGRIMGTVGEGHRPILVARYADVVAAIHPRPHGVVLVLVARATPATAGMDLAGLVAAAGDVVLDGAEVEARVRSLDGRGKGPATALLRRRLADVEAADPRPDGKVRLVALPHPDVAPRGDDPREALRDRVASHAASCLAPTRYWRLDARVHPALASGWTDCVGTEVPETARGPASATLGAAASGGRARRAAAARVVAWLEETGADGLAEEARRRWLGGTGMEGRGRRGLPGEDGGP